MKITLKYVFFLLFYGLVWTITALLVAGVVNFVITCIPQFLLLYPEMGWVVLISWPVNLVWVAWVIVFGGVNIACLHFQRKEPSDDRRIESKKAIILAFKLGLLQAAVAFPTALWLDLYSFALDEMSRYQDWWQTLLVYSSAALTASMAAGWILGLIWTRKVPAVINEAI